MIKAFRTNAVNWSADTANLKSIENKETNF